MIFKVHMLAFMDPYCVREVDVPNDVLRKQLEESDTSTLENAELSVTHLLELIFYYGQNDFQPNPCICSVSMGDVAEVKGKYFICMAVGWLEMNPDQFESYKACDREKRASLVMTLGRVNSLKENFRKG